MTTFLWNHICRWLREDFILSLHSRWKISQFSACNFTNLFLLPQWVLSLKGQFCRCHRKIPTSPFLGALYTGAAEAVGEVRGRGEEKERAGSIKAACKHFSWNITALGFHCPSFVYFCSAWTPVHPLRPTSFPPYDSLPLNDATVWTSSDVKCGFRLMFKNRYIWFGVSILGLVLSLTTQNGWQSMMSEDQGVSA